MRNVIQILGLLLLLAFPNQAIPKEGVPENKLETVKLTLQHLQPKLTDNLATELAQVILTESHQAQIDWKLVVSILNQESSLRRDPQGCLKNPDDCTGDYGIAQIRHRVWKKEFPDLNKKKLMTDYAYAVGTAVKILSHYKAKYEKRELNWFTRYHSGTPEHRSVYMRNLNKSYAKMNVFLEAHYAKLNAPAEEKVAYVERQAD